jgi:3'5'-cyclic nucleotide phosphodiesterase
MQAETEERLGLPVTFLHMYDREAVLKGQLFFVSKIVAPLWDPMTQIFTELSHLADNLTSTQAYYGGEIARCTVHINNKEAQIF